MVIEIRGYWINICKLIKDTEVIDQKYPQNAIETSEK